MELSIPEHLKQIWNQIAQDTSLQWEWEDRFQVALVVVENDAIPNLSTHIEKSLDHTWTVQNIDQASQSVRRVVLKLGGMRDGQVLYATEFTDGTVTFVVFWPWGAATNTSVRAGVVAAEPDNALHATTILMKALHLM